MGTQYIHEAPELRAVGSRSCWGSASKRSESVSSERFEPWYAETNDGLTYHVACLPPYGLLRRFKPARQAGIAQQDTRASHPFMCPALVYDRIPVRQRFYRCLLQLRSLAYQLQLLLMRCRRDVTARLMTSAWHRVVQYSVRALTPLCVSFESLNRKRVPERWRRGSTDYR